MFEILHITHQPGRIVSLLLMGALFFSCEQPGGPVSKEQEETEEEQTQETPQPVAWSVNANGVNNEEDSTILSFSFGQPVPDLTKDHIILTDDTGSVTAGELSGTDSGSAWSLGITVLQAGNIKARITKEGVEAGEKAVAVYQQGEPVILSWTVEANGQADTETTTALTFTFSGPVTGLGGDQVRLDPGTGRASAVDLTGNGQDWLLLIAVEEGGTLSIAIDKEGIAPGPQSLSVHKTEEIPPPEKVGITILSPPDTTYYGKNQAFDTTGLTVAWLYSDGATEEMPPGDYTVVAPDMTQYTPKPIKVRAGGFETSFNINVVNTDKILQSITVSGPDNKVQTLGREFDKTGLVVTGQFSNGTTENLTSMAAITGYDKFRRGPQTVNVRVNSITAPVEGITTRIGEEATVSVYTGYGVKTTFIKGEALSPEKANISFQFRTSGMANYRSLTVANYGLNSADFATLTGFNPNQTGKQTLSMSLDGRSFDIDFYVVEAEPDVWFDFGYMRHAGDPTGHGPGAGVYYAKPGETLIIAPVRYLIGYNDDNSDAGVEYDWTVSGNAEHTTSQDGELLHITPQAAGTSTISVSITGRNYIDGSAITKTASAELVCYTGTVSAGDITFTSPLKNFGPGQMCEGGTGLNWSLGSAGGYEVWTVEHQPSYNIDGNPLTGWREPGVVWMQEDNNGNGLPDEMWYELPGSDETHDIRKNQITRRYAVTYCKAEGSGTVNEYGQIIRGVYWVDSRGRAGRIPGGFPDKYWGVVGDRVTYTGTLLRDDGQIFAVGYNMDGLEGYVDCADPNFLVSKAVKADGTAANLSAVKFIRVQTSMFRYGDIFGDVSTEIQEADFLGVQSFFPKPY